MLKEFGSENRRTLNAAPAWQLSAPASWHSRSQSPYRQSTAQANGRTRCRPLPPGVVSTPQPDGTMTLQPPCATVRFDLQSIPGINPGTGPGSVPGALPGTSAGPGGAFTSVTTPSTSGLRPPRAHGLPSMPPTGMGGGMPDVGHALGPENLAQSFNHGMQAGAPMSAGAESLSQAISAGRHAPAGRSPARVLHPHRARLPRRQPRRPAASSPSRAHMRAPDGIGHGHTSGRRHVADDVRRPDGPCSTDGRHSPADGTGRTAARLRRRPATGHTNHHRVTRPDGQLTDLGAGQPVQRRRRHHAARRRQQGSRAAPDISLLPDRPHRKCPCCNGFRRSGGRGVSPECRPRPDCGASSRRSHARNPNCAGPSANSTTAALSWSPTWRPAGSRRTWRSPPACTY